MKDIKCFVCGEICIKESDNFCYCCCKTNGFSNTTGVKFLGNYYAISCYYYSLYENVLELDHINKFGLFFNNLNIEDIFIIESSVYDLYDQIKKVKDNLCFY